MIGRVGLVFGLVMVPFSFGCFRFSWVRIWRLHRSSPLCMLICFPLFHLISPTLICWLLPFAALTLLILIPLTFIPKFTFPLCFCISGPFSRSPSIVPLLIPFFHHVRGRFWPRVSRPSRPPPGRSSCPPRPAARRCQGRPWRWPDHHRPWRNPWRYGRRRPETRRRAGRPETRRGAARMGVLRDNPPDPGLLPRRSCRAAIGRRWRTAWSQLQSFWFSEIFFVWYWFWKGTVCVSRGFISFIIIYRYTCLVFVLRLKPFNTAAW